jgi:hypothetical protein
VVRFGFSGRDNLIPNPLREWNIDQTVGVDVSQFPPSQPELHPAESMRCDRDLFPAAHRVADTVLCSSDRHDVHRL